MMKQFEQMYSATTQESALLSNVPMSLLNEVKRAYKNEGVDVRVRYRGPRLSNIVVTKNVIRKRTQKQKQSDCLKSEAKSFSVYLV